MMMYVSVQRNLLVSCKLITTHYLYSYSTYLAILEDGRDEVQAASTKATRKILTNIIITYVF